MHRRQQLMRLFRHLHVAPHASNPDRQAQLEKMNPLAARYFKTGLQRLPELFLRHSPGLEHFQLCQVEFWSQVGLPMCLEMGERRLQMPPCLVEVSNRQEAFGEVQAKSSSMEQRAGGVDA